MKKILVVVVLHAICVALPASARPYVGGGIGDSATDAYRTSYNLFGGYQFTRNFGVELAYNDFGDYRGANLDPWYRDARAAALSAAAIGTLSLTENWDVIGKFGFTSNRTRSAGSSRNRNFLAGVGVGYNITPQMGVRLEYEDFGNLPNDYNGIGTQVTNWGVNVKYLF